jgi:hypothetical protein
MWWFDERAAKDALCAVQRIRKRGGASYYGEAHLAARWHLGFFCLAPVKCARCPATEATVDGLINGIHAALDWENAPVERLRVDYAGRIFSIAPEADYVPMCRRCHRKHDQRSWRTFIPAEIMAA